MKYANRIFGYLLLIAGILMIGYSVFNVYQVFKGKMAPYDLLALKPISMDLSKMVEGAPKNANLTQELISSEDLNKPANLAAHIILMGFIVSAGFKIASLGTMLIRTIKVRVIGQRIENSTLGLSQKPPWK